MVDPVITLYNENASGVGWANGLGDVTQAISCKVVEERNGAFELEMKYPVDGILRPYFKPRRILYCKPSPGRSKQQFRIYSVGKEEKGAIKIKAAHISYDLSGWSRLQNEDRTFAWSEGDDNCRPSFEGIPVCYSSGTATVIGKIVQDENVQPFPFNFIYHRSGSTIPQGYSFTFKKGFANARELLGGSSNSILSTFGGEMLFDNYDIHYYTLRGSNKGATLMYRKNIQDLQTEDNSNQMFSAIIPYISLTSNNVVTIHTLEDVYIQLEDTIDYSRIVPVDINSLPTLPEGVKFNEWPGDDAVKRLMNRYIVDSRIGKIKSTITVKYLDIGRKGSVFESATGFENIELCDYVTIIHPDLEEPIIKEVIKTEYDVLTNSYTSIELGENSTKASESSSLSSLLVAMSAKHNDTQLALGNGIAFNNLNQNDFQVVNGNVLINPTKWATKDYVVPNFEGIGYNPLYTIGIGGIMYTIESMQVKTEDVLEIDNGEMHLNYGYSGSAVEMETLKTYLRKVTQTGSGTYELGVNISALATDLSASYDIASQTWVKNLFPITSTPQVKADFTFDSATGKFGINHGKWATQDDILGLVTDDRLSDADFEEDDDGNIYIKTSKWATRAWVESQGYLTSASLTNYLTRNNFDTGTGGDFHEQESGMLVISDDKWALKSWVTGTAIIPWAHISGVPSIPTLSDFVTDTWSSISTKAPNNAVISQYLGENYYDKSTIDTKFSGYYSKTDFNTNDFVENQQGKLSIVNKGYLIEEDFWDDDIYLDSGELGLFQINASKWALKTDIQTYYAGNGMVLNAGNYFSVDTNTIATRSWVQDNFVQKCLKAGTKIKMADGTDKNIEDVEPGDIVLSYDIQNDTTCEAVVLNMRQTGMAEAYIAMVFDNETYVEVYGEHDIYIDDRQRLECYQFMDSGEKAITTDGTRTTFVFREPINHNAKSRHYAIVTSNHLYFANGILMGTRPNVTYEYASEIELPDSISSKLRAWAEYGKRPTEALLSPENLSAILELSKKSFTARSKMEALGKKLKETDHVSIKRGEGEVDGISEEVDLDKIRQRRAWRAEVRIHEQEYADAVAAIEAYKQEHNIPNELSNREKLLYANTEANTALDEFKEWAQSK